jgi:hypothetical protein
MSMPPNPSTPTLAAVAVTLLIILAALGTIALFAIPTQSQWFWPTAGALALTAGLALAIPLKHK